MTTPEPARGIESERLEQATAMLRLGRPAPRRPLDDLVAAIDRTRDAAPLLVRVERDLLDGASAAETLAGRRTSVEAYGALKDRAKRQAVHGPTADARHAGLLAYFLVLAAARRDHGVLLSSRGREEIDAALVDLASVLPEPYLTMVAESLAA